MTESMPERLETIGDPESIGCWEPVLTQDDWEASKVKPKISPSKAKGTKKKAKNVKGKRQTPSQPCANAGVLFHLLEARGLIREQLEPGKWSIICPREHEHSTNDPDGTSTVLFAPNEGEIWGCIKDLHTGHGHDQFQLQDWLRELGATQGEIDAAKAACGARPVIRITSELHKDVDAASEVLGQDPDIYQRNGELVQVVRIARTQAQSTSLKGTPIIHILTPAALADKFNEACGVAEIRRPFAEVGVNNPNAANCQRIACTKAVAPSASTQRDC